MEGSDKPTNIQNNYLLVCFLYNKHTATGAVSVAERSHTTSEVRGRSGRTPCLRGGGQEELPHDRGQGQQLRVPDCDGAGTVERRYPASRSGVAMRGVTHPPAPPVGGQGRRPGGATHA